MERFLGNRLKEIIMIEGIISEIKRIIHSEIGVHVLTPFLACNKKE